VSCRPEQCLRREVSCRPEQCLRREVSCRPEQCLRREVSRRPEQCYAPRLIQQMRYCSRLHTVSVNCLVIERHVRVWAMKTWVLKRQEPHQMLMPKGPSTRQLYRMSENWPHTYIFIHSFIHSFIHCIMSAFDKSAWFHVTWQPRVAVEGCLVASVWVQTIDKSREDAGWAAVLESLCTQSKWLCVYCPGQWSGRGAATVVVSTWPHLLQPRQGGTASLSHQRWMTSRHSRRVRVVNTTHDMERDDAWSSVPTVGSVECRCDEINK